MVDVLLCHVLVFVTDKFSGGGKPGTGIIKIGRNGVTVVVRPEIYVVSQTVFFKPGLHLLGKGGCLERFVRILYGGKDVNRRGICTF